MLTHINIYKRTAAVILGGGIFLSLISGLAIGGIELEFVDRTVLSLAMNESEALQKSWEAYLRDINLKSLAAFKNDIQKSLNQNIFISFEIYDSHKEKIIELSLPGIESVARELEKKSHEFPMNGSVDYSWIYQKGQLYMKFILPLVSEKDGAVLGYFEGIYHVKKNKTDEIINRMLLSVAQTFIAVFLSSLLLYPLILTLNRDLVKTSRSLIDANINTLNSLGSSIAKRDSTTNSHNYRVTIYAVQLAEAAGLSSDQIRSLIKGAFLHDVGKIGISDAILLKKGPLTKDEFNLMKKHVQYGIEIIKSNHWLSDARDVVGHHHERYDGTGYPGGLRGKEIPIAARIFSIADVFDALTSERPYKMPMNPEEAIEKMKKEKGGHFDPVLLEIFFNSIANIHDAFLLSKSDERLREVLTAKISHYFFL